MNDQVPISGIEGVDLRQEYSVQRQLQRRAVKAVESLAAARSHTQLD